VQGSLGTWELCVRLMECSLVGDDLADIRRLAAHDLPQIPPGLGDIPACLRDTPGCLAPTSPVTSTLLSPTAGGEGVSGEGGAGGAVTPSAHDHGFRQEEAHEAKRSGMGVREEEAEESPNRLTHEQRQVLRHVAHIPLMFLSCSHSPCLFDTVLVLWGRMPRGERPRGLSAPLSPRLLSLLASSLSSRRSHVLSSRVAVAVECMRCVSVLAVATLRPLLPLATHLLATHLRHACAAAESMRMYVCRADAHRGDRSIRPQTRMMMRVWATKTRGHTCSTPNRE
jgi:hypothetical protein